MIPNPKKVTYATFTCRVSLVVAESNRDRSWQEVDHRLKVHRFKAEEPPRVGRPNQKTGREPSCPRRSLRKGNRVCRCVLSGFNDSPSLCIDSSLSSTGKDPDCISKK
jgi:hypothetical protein